MITQAQAIAAYERACTLVPKLYCPHQPTAKQAVFLLQDGLEAFYGGAAGGGKSDALLMAALMYVHVPGYSAIIFRRTYKDLNQPGAIMHRSHDWLRNKPGAHWDGGHHRWVFTTPEGGQATLGFGHLDHEKDLYDYQSAEFQFIGFDEETQFPEAHFTFMFSRLRATLELTRRGVPLRMRGASNPGNEGHEWVKKRYVTKADGDQTRIFIPATLVDNPFIDPNYEESLRRTNPLTWQRLRNGDWDATEEGTIFPETAWQFVKVVPTDVAQRVRFWDLAGTAVDPEKKNDPDFTAGVRLSRGRDNRIYVEHCEAFQQEALETRKRVRARAALDLAECGPVVQWVEQEGGSAGKDASWTYLTDVLAGFDVRFFRPTGPKEEYYGPFAAQVQGGNVWLVEGPWNWDFVRWLAAIGTNAATHDDHADAASKAYLKITKSSGMHELMRREHEDHQRAVVGPTILPPDVIAAVAALDPSAIAHQGFEPESNDARKARFMREQDQEMERELKAIKNGSGGSHRGSGWSDYIKEQRRGG